MRLKARVVNGWRGVFPFRMGLGWKIWMVRFFEVLFIDMTEDKGETLFELRIWLFNIEFQIFVMRRVKCPPTP